MTKQEKDHYKEEFGKRLQEVRKRLPTKNGRPFTQEYLSEQFGVDPRTVRRYESGDAFPPFETLQELRKNYGVNLTYILCGEGPLFLKTGDYANAKTQEFCNRLKEVRKKTGLTQMKMSCLIGHHSNSWKEYEKGDREPSYEILVFLHKRLNVDLNWLIHGV